MLVSIVTAVADNGVIGFKNKIPWNQRADMRRFRNITIAENGHCVIVGRVTYDGFPESYKPLPGRTNIIVTRNRQFQNPDALIAFSLEDAIDIAEGRGETEAMIIGGTQIYMAALQADIVDRIYLTRIHGEPKGDAFFPSYDLTNWKETSIESYHADEKNQYPYDFVVLDRIKE